MEQNAAFKSYIYRWHFSLSNFAFITLCSYGSCCGPIARVGRRGLGSRSSWDIVMCPRAVPLSDQKYK